MLKRFNREAYRNTNWLSRLGLFSPLIGVYFIFLGYIYFFDSTRYGAWLMYGWVLGFVMCFIAMMVVNTIRARKTAKRDMLSKLLKDEIHVELSPTGIRQKRIGFWQFIE